MKGKAYKINLGCVGCAEEYEVQDVYISCFLSTYVMSETTPRHLLAFKISVSVYCQFNINCCLLPVSLQRRLDYVFCF